MLKLKHIHILKIPSPMYSLSTVKTDCNITVEKPKIHDLNKDIMVNITSNKRYQHHELLDNNVLRRTQLNFGDIIAKNT